MPRRTRSPITLRKARPAGCNARKEEKTRKQPWIDPWFHLSGQTCRVVDRTCIDRAVVILHLKYRLTVLAKLQALAGMRTAIDRFERCTGRASHLPIRFQHGVRCEFNDHRVILQQMSDTVVLAWG